MDGLFDCGRRGAVSLTYDDALAEHLDFAMADLESAGLRGTFYVPTVTGLAWAERRGDWAAAASRGHELGNHTRHHPCSIRYGFTKPNFSLEAYSLSRMESELVEANREIDEVVGVAGGVRSLAYPCCEDFVGPDRVSIRPMMDRLFPAARAGGDRSADPMTVDMNFVPAFCLRESHSAGAIAGIIDRAVEAGHWCVLMFHGVGGGHGINVRRDTHEAVCRHIADRSGVLWCDTFVNVGQRIRRETKREWGGRR